METVSGKVKFTNVRGFGFIDPDEPGEPDIFFHVTDYDGDFDSIEPGQPVEYITYEELGGKIKRPKAICVIPILEGAKI